MPWDIQDVEKHKKGLTEDQKQLWVKVANSALERCLKAGKAEKFCEVSAIMQANSVVEKNMTYEDWVKQYKIEQTFNLKGVEIFAAGTWNGDTYTEKDLDEMVKAFDEVGFRPPLKLGHNMEQEKKWKDGQPAFGWIDKIYRQGKKLLADFVELPQKIYEALKRGNYKQVSAEIFWNFDRDGKKFPRVLRAVALLGADIPAVSGLDAIEGLYIDDGQDVRTYDFKPGDMDSSPDNSFAVWDTKYINDLPDAAFAIILPGGKKDEEGKTVPRALRKLPHHNESVTDPNDNESIDIPHLKNALSRLSQTSLTPEQKQKALSHLRAHAKALEIGEAAEMAENLIKEEVKNMEKLKEEMERMKQEMDNLKSERENLKQEKEALEAKYSDIEKAKKEAEAKLAEQRAKVKAERIKNFIAEQKKAGKVLPKFEKELEALLKSATDQKAYTYQDDDKKEVNLSQLDLVERIVVSLPKMVEFAEIGKDEEIDLLGDYNHDPGVEVDRRAKLYLDKEKAKTYEEAVEMVLNKDPELKKAYLGGE